MRVLVAFLALSLAAAAVPVGTDASALILDDNDRLASHYLVFTKDCEPQMSAQWKAGGHKLRTLLIAADSLAMDLFGHKGDGACEAVCLERGTHRDYVVQPLPINRFDPEKQTIQEFLNDCQSVEIGFIQVVQDYLRIYRINDDGERIAHYGDFGMGEKSTYWIPDAKLGWKFEIASDTEVFANPIAEFNGAVVIGTTPPLVNEYGDMSEGIEQTLSGEWDRSRVVKRTFTEIGFNKGRLPDDLWGSMSAFYYNNRNRAVREAWDMNALYVNHWEVDVTFIAMPWQLKTYWQARLQDLVEEWIGGVPLEKTDIYGMRRYNDGARLLTHVDRESTHAASLIINVHQDGLNQPWPLEIYDHADRLHEIYMEPGDIVYYESARCLHGRQQALDGGYFVNLFAHYRPIGDPQWYTRKNPPTAPKPLMDIGDCKPNDEGGVDCTGGEVDRPEVLALGRSTLSPHMQRLTGPNSLWEWWQEVTPASPDQDEDEL